MNRKVGHAHTMVIYTMDGLGEVGFPLIQLGTPVLHILFVFVALRPKSTAMVIAGRSVNLTTLFPGQA